MSETTDVGCEWVEGETRWMTELLSVIEDLEAIGYPPTGSVLGAEAAFERAGSHRPRSLVFPAQLTRHLRSLDADY